VKGDAEVSPSMLAQGGSGELRVTVRNAGDEEAESVSVKVFKDSSHPFEFDEIYDFVGDLGPNETGDAVFRFTIDGNAVLKKHLVGIEMRYVDGTVVETESATIPIDVTTAGTDLRPAIAVMFIVIVAAATLVWKKKR
jgi:hypothetical protein